MDLSRPVEKVTLEKGTELISYRNRAQPYGELYTVRGASPHSLGIDPFGRALGRFRVERHIEGLRSYTTSLFQKPGGLAQITIDRRHKGTLSLRAIGSRDH